MIILLEQSNINSNSNIIIIIISSIGNKKTMNVCCSENVGYLPLPNYFYYFLCIWKIKCTHVWFMISWRYCWCLGVTSTSWLNFSINDGPICRLRADIRFVVACRRLQLPPCTVPLPLTQFKRCSNKGKMCISICFGLNLYSRSTNSKIIKESSNIKKYEKKSKFKCYHIVT